ncbi:MAG: cytochrome c oxidase subunit 3 [Pseudomonadota bacterium]
MSEATADTKSDGVPHPYHLVNPSAWPILGAFAGGILATGAILYMHYDTLWLMLVGFIAVFAVMYGWWRDVVLESVREKAHTSIVKIGLRYGMMLFIASEVMFFVAFFWAYFNAALFPTEATGFQWPPVGIEAIPTFDLPLLMTLVLLLSGTTVTWAHHEILHGNNKDASTALGITVLLGIFFTAIQVYEYDHVDFGFTDGIFSSTFFMATGFHGFHVLIGTIFLFICWLRTRSGHFNAQSHYGFEAASWYWHFVDVVWLFLFVAVYWWGGAGAPH